MSCQLRRHFCAVCVLLAFARILNSCVDALQVRPLQHVRRGDIPDVVLVPMVSDLQIVCLPWHQLVHLPRAIANSDVGCCMAQVPI